VLVFQDSEQGGNHLGGTQLVSLGDQLRQVGSSRCVAGGQVEIDRLCTERDAGKSPITRMPHAYGWRRNLLENILPGTATAATIGVLLWVVEE
jgi:hypothetical protein